MTRTTSQTADLRPEILPLGADGLLLRFATVLRDDVNRAVARLAAVLKRDPVPGVAEICPSLASVYLRLSLDVDRAMVLPQIRDRIAHFMEQADADSGTRRTWRIPVSFGGDNGPDLMETAALLGVTEAQAIAELSATPVRVLALGFAPGQPYLGMLPERWNIPRLSELTPQVPQGAIVVAVRQLVLFANPSPTGWRHIGQSGFHPFRPDADTPFALQPGDRVRLMPVSAAELGDIRAANTDGLGGAVLDEA